MAETISFGICKNFDTPECPFYKNYPPTAKELKVKCSVCGKWQPNQERLKKFRKKIHE